MKKLISDWFEKWTNGEFNDLPISPDFRHTSPFGTIKGKKAYLDLVRQNKDKFLGHTFLIHDGIYGSDHACVRYTARQGKDFSLDVSEWYYGDGNRIKEIIAYYHIGEIKEERQIENYSN